MKLEEEIMPNMHPRQIQTKCTETHSIEITINWCEKIEVKKTHTTLA